MLKTAMKHACLIASNCKRSQSNDRSKEDFAITCRMIREGHSDEEIFEELIKRSKGQERGKSYVKFTIRNAHRAVERKEIEKK